MASSAMKMTRTRLTVQLIVHHSADTYALLVDALEAASMVDIEPFFRIHEPSIVKAEIFQLINVGR